MKPTQPTTLTPELKARIQTAHNLLAELPQRLGLKAKDIAAVLAEVHAIQAETDLTLYALGLIASESAEPTSHRQVSRTMSEQRKAEIRAAIAEGRTLTEITQQCHCAKLTVLKLRRE